MTSAPSRPHAVLINRCPIPIDGYSPQATLLDFIRDHGLTGAKEGCAEGECGACTVAMVSPDCRGSRYQPVNSCLMFLAAAADREFYTVEGLAHCSDFPGAGELTEAQRAMAAAGGSQCGYCTPGFVMSLFAEQYRPDRRGPCDPRALEGNLCRCTGYRPIWDAALSLGPAPNGWFKDRLSRPAPELAPFEYSDGRTRFERPGSLAECVTAASENAAAKFVSGATDLAVESNLRFRRWPHLISLESLPELGEFHETAESIRIGAGLTLTQIEQRWRNAPRFLGSWLQMFASPAIRNRATLGGNLATASPIGDSAPLLLALNASVHLSSVGGERTIPLSSFFTGYRKTQLEPGELIRSIDVPKPLPAFTRFYKGAKRRVDDISTVAAGFSIDLDRAGRIERAVFAFGGVAPKPLRLFAAEDVAIGLAWNEATTARIQREIDRGIEPIDDHRGSAAYRRALAMKLMEKFWHEWRDATP